MRGLLEEPTDPFTSPYVSSVNGLTGAITLAAGAGISITPVGNTLTFSATGSIPILTATQVAFGSAGNTITSSSDLTFIDATNTLNVNGVVNATTEYDINGNFFATQDSAGKNILIGQGSSFNLIEFESITIGNNTINSISTNTIIVGSDSSNSAQNTILIGNIGLIDGNPDSVLAVGHSISADADSTFATIIGHQAQSSSGGSIALGYSSTAASVDAISIGKASVAGAEGAISLGTSASTGVFSVDSIALGHLANSDEPNEMVVKLAQDATIWPTNIYLGWGKTMTGFDPADEPFVGIHATSASGTDANAAHLYLYGGQNTGTGTPGAIAFFVSRPETSGSSLATPYSALAVNSDLVGVGFVPLILLNGLGYNMSEFTDNAPTQYTVAFGYNTSKSGVYIKRAIGAPTTVTFPDMTALPFPYSGEQWVYIVKDSKGDAGTNNITLASAGAQTFDGSATFVLDNNFQSVTLVFDVLNNNWSIVSNSTNVSTGTFATRALDNLSSVAINTSLLPGVSDGAALGSTAKQWSDLFLAEGGVINWDNGDATLTQNGNVLTLAGADFVADNITANTAFLPDTNGGAALGTTALQFSNLFLATGATINFANGNEVLTHSSGVLTVSTGDLRVATAGGAVTSVLTSAGVQTISNKSIDNTNTINIMDNRFTLQDGGDTTKRLVFELNGISTATTRTWTVQNVSGTVYVSGGTDIPVTDGGTGLSAGTSGGIPYFDSSTTMASSAELTANVLIAGGGAGTTPKSIGAGLGTTTQVLHGNAGGTPTWGAVNLAADVTGDLPFANLTQIAGLSVLGVTGTGTADVAAITGTADQVLRVNTAGTSLAFGTVATAGIANNAVTYAKIQQGSAHTMLVNNTGGAANFAETTYNSPGLQALAATVTWTAGVAPSGASSLSYNWIQIGNFVSWKINLTYATDGTTVTVLNIAFPSDMPNPVEPTGFTGASDWLYKTDQFAWATTTTGTTPISNVSAFLRRNSGDTAYEFNVSAASSTVSQVWWGGQYFTS